MIKITVEEIEILVTAKVEDNLRQNMPKIRAMVDKIRQEFEKTDTTGIEKNVKKSISQASNVIKQIVPKLKQNFSNIVDDKSKQKIIDLEKEIAKLEKQINSKQLKLDITNNALDTIREDTKQKNIAEMPDAGAKRINNATLLDLSNNDNFNSMVAESDKLASSIDRDNIMLEATKSKLQELRSNAEQVTQSQSKWSIIASVFKQGIESAKQSVSGISSKVQSAFSKLHGVFSKVKDKLKDTFSGNSIKGGLKQVLRYAGALLSIRSVYMMLRQSANAWLSSQNSQAQQLNANLQYMQYAMGSALSPIIEYLINLVYKLMKAIQSVVYALFKVNIFAKASASSMKGTAQNTKKAKQEAKQLAGIHSEINNIQSNNSNDNSGGSGGVTPNIDLTDVDMPFVDKIKNLDFEELGKQLGEKLNSALESIPWEKIQNTAKTIAGNIAKFLNGFIEATDWKLVGKTYSEGINTILYAGETFVNTFKWDSLGKTIGNGLNGVFENYDWGASARTLSGGIKGIFDTISGFFETFSWKGLVDGIFTWIKEFKWSNVSDAIFKALGSACASLVNLGMVIGEHIKNAFTNIGQYFNGKIQECGGNIVAGIFKGIGDAIAGIGQWIHEHIFTPFINGFKNVFKIHSPSQVMAEMGGFIIQGLKNSLANIWSFVGGIFSNLVGKIGEKFTQIKDGIVNWASNTVEKVKNWGENIKNKVSSAWQNIHSKISEKASNIGNTISTKFNQAKETISNWGNTIKSKVSNAFENMKNNVTNGVNNIKNSISNKFNQAKNVISNWGNGVKTLWKGIWDKMPDGVKNGLNKAKDTISNWGNNIKSTFQNIGSKAVTWGKDMMKNMAGGIKKGLSTVSNAVNGVASKIKSLLGFSEPEEGPLSNFHTYMPDMIDLMVEGIHKNMNKVNLELEKMANKMSYTINAPQLNKESIATRETLAIFREYSNANTNSEVTAPQNILKETLREKINTYAENNRDSQIKLIVNVSNKKLGDILIDDLRDRKRRTGDGLEAWIGG